MSRPLIILIVVAVVLVAASFGLAGMDTEQPQVRVVKPVASAAPAS